MALTYCFLVRTHAQWASQGDGFTIMRAAHMQTLQKLRHFYGDIELYFHMFHFLTRCDTTSYYHNRGKNIPWNRVTNHFSLLSMTEHFGNDKTSTDATLDDCM